MPNEFNKIAFSELIKNYSTFTNTTNSITQHYISFFSVTSLVGFSSLYISELSIDFIFYISTFILILVSFISTTLAESTISQGFLLRKIQDDLHKLNMINNSNKIKTLFNPSYFKDLDDPVYIPDNNFTHLEFSIFGLHFIKLVYIIFFYLYLISKNNLSKYIIPSVIISHLIQRIFLAKIFSYYNFKIKNIFKKNNRRLCKYIIGDKFEYYLPQFVITFIIFSDKIDISAYLLKFRTLKKC
jgi:hypothetical protein